MEKKHKMLWVRGPIVHVPSNQLTHCQCGLFWRRALTQDTASPEAGGCKGVLASMLSWELPWTHIEGLMHNCNTTDRFFTFHLVKKTSWNPAVNLWYSLSFNKLNRVSKCWRYCLWGLSFNIWKKFRYLKSNSNIWKIIQNDRKLLRLFTAFFISKYLRMFCLQNTCHSCSCLLSSCFIVPDSEHLWLLYQRHFWVLRTSW